MKSTWIGLVLVAGLLSCCGTHSSQRVENCRIGSSLYASGTPNPGNPCESCQPTVSTTLWTNVSDGTACGGGEVCSAGSCLSGCWIGNTFYPSGTDNPENTCQSCLPSTDTTAWSNIATGVGCDSGQVCDAGVCVSACWIDATLYVSAAPNPENPCQNCQPLTSTTQWTDLTDGTGCGTGGVCSVGSCQDGCWIDSSYQTSGAGRPGNSCQSCQQLVTTTSWSNVADGTSCGTGKVCSVGSCQDGCWIDSSYQASGGERPGNSCQSCQQLVTTTSWSNVADGTSCGTGKVCGVGACQTGCWIDSSVFASAAPDPNNPCLSCQPLVSTLQWTNADGTSCGTGKVCSVGTCQIGCWIDATYYSSWAANPTNSCQGCLPETSTTNWSDLVPAGNITIDANAATDIQVARSLDFTEATTIMNAGAAVGTIIYDQTHGVAGIALSKTPAGSTVSVEENDTRTVRLAALTISNPITQTFTTWDGYPALRASYDVLGTVANLRGQTNAIVSAYYPAATGLLTGTSVVSQPYKLEVEFVRRDDNHMVITFGVAGATSYTSAQRFRLDDIAGGTGLAKPDDGNVSQCEAFDTQGTAIVDFLWVVDDSGSMATGQAAVANAGTTMMSRLAAAPIDWRIGGVTTGYYVNSSASEYRPFSTDTSTIVGWFTQNNVCSGMNCSLSGTPCVNGCWWGNTGTGTEKSLLSAQQYIKNGLLPTQLPADGYHLRTGATLALIVLGDADDQSTAADIAPDTDFVAHYTSFFNSYNPANPSARAPVSGIVCPLGSNCNGETQMNPRLNLGVIANTSGALGDFLIANAGSDLTPTIDGILDAAIFAASPYHPSSPPIAATMRVAMQGPTVGSCNIENVPRDLSNGYAFDAPSGRLAFFGTCRPQNAGQKVVISYRSWVDNTPIP